MANRRWTSQFLFQYETMPVLLSCNFVVDRTNANGLGIRSLKGNGILNVFMDAAPVSVPTTSVFLSGVTQIVVASVANLYIGQTVTDGTTGGNITSGTKILNIVPSQNLVYLSKPTAGASASSPGDTLNFQFAAGGVGNLGIVNPKPAAGLILAQLSDNYSRYLSGWGGFVSPVGSPTTAVTSGLTAHAPYVITVLGTTTLAEWQSIGLPVGLTPTVGQSFIATATGTGGSHTGKVGIPGVSGALTLEVIGDPNQSIAPANSQQNGGAWILSQALAPTISTGAYVAPLIPTAPAAGTVVGLNFYLSNSANTVNGQ